MRDCSREIPSELPPLPQWSCNSRSGPGKRRLQPRSCREHRERRRIFRSAETACGTLLLRSGIPPFTWRAVRVGRGRSEEHTSELQSRLHLVCRLLLEKKKKVSVNTLCEQVNYSLFWWSDCYM